MIGARRGFRSPALADRVWSGLPRVIGWLLRVLLVALFLGWAAEIKLAGQFGDPLPPTRPVVPAGLLGATVLAAGLIFGVSESWIARRQTAWWQTILWSMAGGLTVALVGALASRLVPAWRDTSLFVLTLFGILLPVGAGWLAAIAVRSAMPGFWQRILHPFAPPLLVGLALILAGLLWPVALGSGQQPGSRNLLANPGRTIFARYSELITYSTFPILTNWESQPGIYAPPPTEMTISVHVPAAARLSVTAGLRPSLFLADGAGVRFQIAWASRDSSRILYDQTLFQENLNRFGDRQPVEVDLSDLADRDGRLIFRTIPVGTPPGPLIEAAWLNPRILSRASLPATEGLIRDGLLALVVGALVVAWLRLAPEEA